MRRVSENKVHRYGFIEKGHEFGVKLFYVM
jgi:hypothetical protein